MGRTYAGILGPLAFTTILVRGLVWGESVDPTLKLAMTCLFAFAGLGFVIGRVAEATILESVRTRFNANTPAHDEDALTPTAK